MSQTKPQTKYNVEFNINGEIKKKQTNDIAKAIEEVTPPVVLTGMYVTIKKGAHLIERRLNLVQARRVFLNPTYREIFVNNLMLERYG